MRVLVVGGSGSGKSAYAEDLCCSLSNRRTYIATMRPVGSDARNRIARHRMQRANKGFCTVECLTLDEAFDMVGEAGGAALVDDLGNLLANHMFLPDGSTRNASEVVEAIVRDTNRLCSRFHHIVAVGVEAGCEGDMMQEGTASWVRAMGTLNCKLASQFDRVVEVVAGVPCVVKDGTVR